MVQRLAWVTAAAALSALGCSATSDGPSSNPGGSSGTGARAGSGGSAAGSGGSAAAPSGGGASGSAGAGGGSASFPACSGDQATFDAFAAKIGSDIASHNVVGGALAVVCGGTTIYATGLGSVEKGGKPVTAQTRFQLASVTKSLTAALAVRLSEKGVLGLDDPASQWLPYVNTQAPYTQGFTLAELLSHTSGYPAGIDTADYTDLEASFKQNANVALWSPPGEVFNYSNDGFSMAGLVLQTAAGQPFATLIENEVMKPAGMQHASMHAQDVQNEGDYALGYDSYSGQVNKPTDSYYAMPYYGPMGGAWASAEDLAHFAQALMNDGGALFGKASLDKMSADRTHTTWGTRDYGLGLFVDDLSGTPEWGHDGSVGGFLSSYSIIPTRGFAVIILVNSDSYMPDPYELVDEATKLFTGSALPWPSTYGSFQESSKADHVGTYQSNTLGKIDVQNSGGQMQMIFGGQTLPLTPAWQDSYFFNYQSYDLDANFWRIGGSVKYVVTAYGVGARVN